MKAAAHQPARKAAAPVKGTVRAGGERRPSIATIGPLPMLHAPPMVQRRCACGGSCPRCSEDEDKTIRTKRIENRAVPAPPGDGWPAIGQRDDRFEAEADRVARLVAGPEASPPASPPTPEPAIPQPVSLTQGALSTGGEPLSPALRRHFEARFGRDLSAVRVHRGDDAGTLNDTLHSHAFTYGSHIWLARGHSPRADFLLAHELAHVVQQGGAGPMPERAARSGRDLAQLRAAEPTVQRFGFGGGLPFWMPLGAAGGLTGTDIHHELLEDAKAANPDIDVEAPAPNADLRTWGLNLQGSIDLYKSPASLHVMPGLYFDGAKGAKDADVLTATPKKHRRASAKAVGASFKPSVKGTTIGDIAGGPTEIQLGELKPASKDMISAGSTQLQNYISGLKDAKRLTNDWAGQRRLADRWSLSDPELLPHSAVTFKKGGKDLKYDPASPRNDKSLVLATITENPIVGGKYGVTVRFNPKAHGLPEIKGGLYAQEVQGVDGLWMYFGRPQDLTAALGLARSALTRGEMTLANQVQDEVINGLLTSPKQVHSLRRTDPPPLEVRPPLVTPVPTGERGLVRRKPKPAPKLDDPFTFATWQPKVKKLRAQVTGATGGEQKKQMASLELLEGAYAADDVLADVPGTGGRVLPEKAKDAVTITAKAPGAAATATPKKTTRNLGDLFGWLKGWTSLPVEQVLGRFRERFGGSFVWVANKFATIREKVRDKFSAAFKKHSSSASGGKAKIIFKALGKALMQMAKVLAHQAVRRITTAVETGITRKLEKMFDISPEKLAEETFGEEFAAFTQPLEAFKTTAEERVRKTVEEYAGDLSWIEEVKDLSATVGPILEGAAIALQCATPPGWGCLKILLRKLQDCAIEAALNMCPVQKEIAGLVHAIGPVAKLPETLANLALDKMKEVAPKGLEDVFDRPAPGPADPSPDEIECEDTPVDSCPSLFKGSGSGSGSGESKPDPVHDKLRELQQEFSEDELQGLTDITEAAGMPDDAPITPDQVDGLKERLARGRGLSRQDFTDMANGQASPEVEGKLKPLQDFVEEQARQAVKDQILRDLQAGKYKDALNEMAREKRHWRILHPYRKGPFKNYPVLMWDSTTEGAGVVDGVFGDCTGAGIVPVDVTRADVFDRAGDQIPVTTPFHVDDGQMASKACGLQPPPPPRQKGKSGDGGDSGGAKVSPPIPGPIEGPATGGQSGSSGGTGGGSGSTGPAGRGSKGGEADEGKGDGSGGSPHAGVSNFFDFCPNVLDCPFNAFTVIFEEVGGPSDGWEALPGDPLMDPKGTGSIRKPVNPSAIIQVEARPDGTFDVVQVEGGKRIVVGSAKKSGDRFEVTSGPMLEQMRRALRKYVKKNRGARTNRSERIHFQ